MRHKRQHLIFSRALLATLIRWSLYFSIQTIMAKSLQLDSAMAYLFGSLMAMLIMIIMPTSQESKMQLFKPKHRTKK